MTISSSDFFLFTTLILVIYYAIPSKFQNSLLLIASYIFLFSWNSQFALVFGILTFLNYQAGNAIYKADDTGQKGRLLTLAVLINIGALIFFKYGNFFIPDAITFLQNLGIQANVSTLNILLPIGLSFYVVQAISYLIDINRNVSQPAENLIGFGIYMAYFPRLISGPIERARDFLPQLESARTFSWDRIGDGLVLIGQGLLRKVIIADLLFVLLPTNVFSEPHLYTSFDLLLFLLVFSFALYNDFAGYTLLARGISLLFGISLVPNFNAPYLSRTFNEFWQSWHISLSNWLRDYIFMRASRGLLRRKYSRNHAFSIILPPMLTLFVSALWHDISLNMILWGLMHGLYLVAERFITLNNPPQAKAERISWRVIIRVLIVFALTILAWVPFQTDIATTIYYWSHLLSPIHWINDVYPAAVMSRIFSFGTADVLILVGLSFVLDSIHIRKGELFARELSPLKQAILINLIIFALLLAGMVQTVPPPFIYQGF